MDWHGQTKQVGQDFHGMRHSHLLQIGSHRQGKESGPVRIDLDCSKRSLDPFGGRHTDLVRRAFHICQLHQSFGMVIGQK